MPAADEEDNGEAARPALPRPDVPLAVVGSGLSVPIGAGARGADWGGMPPFVRGTGNAMADPPPPPLPLLALVLVGEDAVRGAGGTTPCPPAADIVAVPAKPEDVGFPMDEVADGGGGSVCGGGGKV